jgi:hypothetical protein
VAAVLNRYTLSIFNQRLKTYQVIANVAFEWIRWGSNKHVVMFSFFLCVVVVV